MRYKAYITDSNQIFWTKNSTDKPNKDYFNRLMNSVNWVELGNITPNFINQFNCSITVDKDTYTYLKLVDNRGITKYFCVDSIDKVLKDGFVINLSLDVFTTYGYYLFENITNKSIFVNRTSACGIYAKNETSQLMVDELIPFDNAAVRHLLPDYDNKQFAIKNRNSHGKSGEPANINPNSIIKLFGAVMSTDEWKVPSQTEHVPQLLGMYIKFQEAWGDNPPWYENALFDVYQDTNGDYYFFPIFSQNVNTYGILENRLPALDGLESNTTFYPRFSEYFVESVKYNQFWSNKYKGRFSIPCWDILLASNRWGIIINKIRPGLGLNKNEQTLFCFVVKQGIINLYSNPETIKHTAYWGLGKIKPGSVFESLYYMSKVRQPNNATPILQCYYTKINIDTPASFKPYFWFTQYKYRDAAVIQFVFNETSGAEFFSSIYILSNLCKMSGFETLPVSTNTYTQYLAGVQSSQNTSLQIAKQQQIMSSVSAGVNGALGLVNSVKNAASGNFFGGAVGAISTIFNTGMGITNAAIQYENTKRNIDASNADKFRTSTANNINTTDKANNYWNAVSSRYKFSGAPPGRPVYPFNFFSKPVVLFHNRDQMRTINKIIWESGYLINAELTLNSFNIENKIDVSFFDDYINDFVYWDLDVNTDYVKQIFKNSNNELIDAITIICNNPVRFWKKYPDYKTELKETWKGE